MEAECKYLFIYGTLLNAENEFGDYLKSNSQYIGEGSFHGRLYDLGEYPGAVFDADSEGKVYGSIVALEDKPEVLKHLDDYEGFNGNADDTSNLYLRKIVAINTLSEKIDCWVYLYNQSISDKQQINSGRYR